MKTIDGFLACHDVDVGKSFGLLSLAGAGVAFYGMLGQLFVGRMHIDLSVPIGIVMGIALWRHTPWSRTVLLGGRPICGDACRAAVGLGPQISPSRWAAR